MKKTFLILFILGSYILISNSLENKITIPNESIRIRVIGSSNDSKDQNVKLKVKENIEKELYDKLKNAKNIKEARNILENSLEQIDSIVTNTLLDEKYDLKHKVNYGYNYFPEKNYKGITYNEGLYESLLVTLGEAKGDNWWCVLFPPLCFLEARTNDNIEYRSFVKEIIDKYM